MNFPFGSTTNSFSFVICKSCGKSFEILYGSSFAVSCEDCILKMLGVSPEIHKTRKLILEMEAEEKLKKRKT